MSVAGCQAKHTSRSWMPAQRSAVSRASASAAPAMTALCGTSQAQSSAEASARTLRANSDHCSVHRDSSVNVITALVLCRCGAWPTDNLVTWPSARSTSSCRPQQLWLRKRKSYLTAGHVSNSTCVDPEKWRELCNATRCV